MSAGEVAVERLTAPPRLRDGRVDVLRLRAAFGPGASLLESSPGTPHGIPWSLVSLPSGQTVEDDGTGTRLRTQQGERPIARDPFVAIDLLCEELGLDPAAEPPGPGPPFTGGLVGAFSYELGRRIEDVPSLARRDRPVPDLHLAVAPAIIAVDHREEQAWAVRRRLGELDPPGLAEIESRVVDAPAVGQPSRPRPVEVTTSSERGRYLEAVESVLERIAAGDVFQVNLSQRLTAPWPHGITALYQRLREASPAPHAALIPQIGIASISPESFLLANGREVVMRPMKGTRPRHHDRAQDAAAADDLASSRKDRAENIMVVDLQRNDLGRVCVDGSVSVPHLCELEAHPTVWQLVSTVRGTLSPDVGWGSLLRATLPCGSVTGAPKVAAMNLIEQHEPVRRGWYCGAIGWIGAGTLRLSVAIRTAALTNGCADYGAGGGIVADSDPAEEYAETIAKSRAFFEAVEGHLVEVAS